ncbi:MAG: lysophospholipid acyltransferase family protein [Polyangiaceae bacterium]
MRPSLALSLRNVYETLAISFPTVIEAIGLFGRQVTREVCDERLDGWCKAVVANARIDVEVRGRENLVDGETYLVMSNHQSHYDIPVLFYVIGPNLRMIAKKELFAFPVFGDALRAAGFVEIDRSDRHAAIRNLDHAQRLLKGGTHVWIAPEGTRSPTGQLGPFKKGAFYLALEAGLPILPVTLVGTRDVLPAQGLFSSAGAHVRVTIHPKIDPRPYAAKGKAGRQELIDAVRGALEAGL